MKASLLDVCMGPLHATSLQEFSCAAYLALIAWSADLIFFAKASKNAEKKINTGGG
jgi:hypothetical protein